MCWYAALSDRVARVVAGCLVVSTWAGQNGCVMGMWDLKEALTLLMLMVSASSVDGGGHHFHIQNVAVSE